jgi:hypothetical protein
MTNNDTDTTRHATGQPTSGDVTGGAPVLAAVWCCSVGTTWTLELHQLRRGTPHTTLVDWISSGVPISQPEPPDALDRELLTQRGLHLFRDSFIVSWTGSRRAIGYVAGDAELITLAHLLHDDALKIGLHPVTLAAQWVAAGFSAHAAARWIRYGIHSPQAAPHPRASSEPRRAATPPAALSPGPAGSAIAGESNSLPPVQDPTPPAPVDAIEDQHTVCRETVVITRAVGESGPQKGDRGPRSPRLLPPQPGRAGTWWRWLSPGYFRG